MQGNFKVKNVERKHVYQICSDRFVRSLINEKKLYFWFNVLFDSFCVPSKKPISKFSQYPEDGSYSNKCFSHK